MTAGLVGLSSCSEEDATENEFDNWQQRNEEYVASLVSARSYDVRYKLYSLDESKEGAATDYVYVTVLESGDADGGSPMYTDSVRVSYQGRLIPTKTYPEGYVFDGTVFGNYDLSTTATAKFLPSSLVDGFTTALLHMHRGDRWRVSIPYQLGYGSTVQSSIPAYSTLVFDIMLVDFSPAGETMPVWSARRE